MPSVLNELVQGKQIHGRVLLVPCKQDLSTQRQCTVAYTSVTLNKVPEQHGHVYLVGLYLAWFAGEGEAGRVPDLDPVEEAAHLRQQL